MKRLNKFWVILSLLFILAACNKNSDVVDNSDTDLVKFNISTPDADTASVTLAAKELAKVINEKSNGQIEVEVHANGTLYGGDPSGAIKQLGSGGLDLLVLSTSLYANFDPRFNVISIPYLFKDEINFVDYLNSDLGSTLLKDLEKMKIQGLGYWPRDFRQITNSVKPITQPSDLKNIKLRVPNNPLWVEFFSSAGTITTPMDFSEVYNALQLKTIDGQENPMAVITSSNIFEVQKYLTISNHMADGWLVGMNDNKFNKLSDEHQKIILDAVNQIQDWIVDYDAQEMQKSIKLVESKGMQVNKLTSNQKQEFTDLAKKSNDTFKSLVKDDDFYNKTIEFISQ